MGGCICVSAMNLSSLSFIAPLLIVFCQFGFRMMLEMTSRKHQSVNQGKGSRDEFIIEDVLCTIQSVTLI